MILVLSGSTVPDTRPTSTAVNFQFCKIRRILRAGYQAPHRGCKSSCSVLVAQAKLSRHTTKKREPEYFK